MFNFPLFIHLAGLIIGLGAVTVIDFLGFTSRKSKNLTQVTISAHHVTKPLIWLGTILLAISWIFLYENNLLPNLKSILLLIMVLNGIFLSFYVSPRLDNLIGKNVLLPFSLQVKITISMLISFFSWWTFVVLTVISLS
ncbi:hypothetical protein KA107_03255 [Candidatus Pacearchaeota archaeon]|nr:hypothetical protein [Candidatus Pacearchaeota archaeon]